MKSFTKETVKNKLKTGRGVAKKNMKIRTSTTVNTHPFPNQRMDEDSGLGGDSSSLDISMDCSPKKEFNSVSTNGTLMFHSFGSDTSKNVSEVNHDLQSNSVKRLRLDMNEEANELPEDKSVVENSQLKQISFKNVPELMLPTANLSQSAQHLRLGPLGESVKSIHSVLPILQHHHIVKMERPKQKKARLHHPLEGNYSSKSSDGVIELQLLWQPEQQHRARYQTEGSRGAVKDELGQGHPTVKLCNYNKTTTLHVFVASDGGSVNPHIFYQACKVSGKNSTPCKEVKINGTVVLHIDMLPEKDMLVSCDCVGILKERNVDVEKKVKASISGRKKSTKCRLVFQVSVTLDSGEQELLQVVSRPINCTQPPGIPEIGRKSLCKASVKGGDELFVIGKNFPKDTRVIFQDKSSDKPTGTIWSQTVVPDKDVLHPTHLICKVPAYGDLNITKSVDVDLMVISCEKTSDAHTFTYTPLIKEAPVDYVPTEMLPKGVSPSAVEVNRLFTESGNITLPKEFPLKQSIGTILKEPSIAYPTCKTGSSIDIKPTIFSSKPNAGSMRMNSASHFEQTRKPVILPQRPVATHSFVSTDPNNVAMVEKWVQLLALLKTFPDQVNTPVVEYISSQIQKLMENQNPINETNGKIPANAEQKPVLRTEQMPTFASNAPQVLPCAIIPPLQKKESLPKHQWTSNGIRQIVYASQSENSYSPKVIPLVRNHQGSLVVQQFPVASRQAMNSVNEVVSVKCKHSSGTIFKASHPTNNARFKSSHGQQNFIPVSVSQQNVTGSENLNLVNHSERLNFVMSPSLNNNNNASMSPMYFSNSGMLLNNSRPSPMLSEASCPSPMLCDPSMVNNNSNNSNMMNFNVNEFENTSGLQMPNCDPLLSDANPTSIRTFSSTAPSAITSGSSDVATEISRLSESELINFINPTYFENV